MRFVMVSSASLSSPVTVMPTVQPTEPNDKSAFKGTLWKMASTGMDNLAYASMATTVVLGAISCQYPSGETIAFTATSALLSYGLATLAGKCHQYASYHLGSHQ